MEPEVQKEKEEEFANNSDDWNNRVLCSDGNCIGLSARMDAAGSAGKNMKVIFPR